MYPAHALAFDGIQRVLVAQGKTRLDCFFSICVCSSLVDYESIYCLVYVQ